MKKTLITSLLLFIPCITAMADHCTNPGEYTIDRRCYVTAEQKETQPYNATVALVDGSGNAFCTGTIVTGKSGKLYLITAKHCTEKQMYNVGKKLTIRLQDGTILNTTYGMTGNYTELDIPGKGEVPFKFDGDMAVYPLGSQENNKNVNFVKLSDAKSGYSVPARVIGYGALKIMSDKEIKKFKEEYIEWLNNNRVNVQIFTSGLTKSGGVPYDEAMPFIVATEYWRYFYDTNNLKVSNCWYQIGNTRGKMVNCQSWGGNSGGGIFDDDGNIMAILTRGNRDIGGSEHASDDGKCPFCNVLLLKEQK